MKRQGEIDEEKDSLKENLDSIKLDYKLIESK